MPQEIEELPNQGTWIWEGWVFEGVSIQYSCTNDDKRHGLGHLAEPLGWTCLWSL